MKKLIQLIKEYYILYTAFGPLQRKWLLFLKNNPDVCTKCALGFKDNNARLGYKACCLGQAAIMLGIAKWRDNKTLIVTGDLNTQQSDSLLHYDHHEKLGLYGASGLNKGGDVSLSIINDAEGWLAVYKACIDNPKGYFNKRV